MLVAYTQQKIVIPQKAVGSQVNLGEHHKATAATPF